METRDKWFSEPSALDFHGEISCESFNGVDFATVASLPWSNLLPFFDFLPGLIFYAKDCGGRFIAANRAMLRTKCLQNPDELLGKSDRDFHPPVLAASYVSEDREVMQTRRPIVNRPAFVLDRSGRPGWFNSSKLPLFDGLGRVVGIAGVRYPTTTPEDRKNSFRGLISAAEHMERFLDRSVSIQELAAIVGLSPSHFTRQFVAVFGMPPNRFLQSLRMEKARHLLVETDLNIGEIAVEIGYHDQSHFTRRFRAIMGVTPGFYRSFYRR